MAKCPRHAGPGRAPRDCVDCHPGGAERWAHFQPRPSPAQLDLDRRWRPVDHEARPACDQVFDGKRCGKRGPHYCEPRADVVVAWFHELIVHTKGIWARRQFQLAGWQEWQIIRPLFGEVIWSTEHRCYVRRYHIAYVVLARKNGKSALLSGLALYLTVGDHEESAEVYGAARDSKQAGKVFEPAQRMVQLSPELRKRLEYNKNARRLYDERTASFYETITSDSMANLGHNPHGFILDEVLSQRDHHLWEAVRTGAGTRAQPMMVAISTETSDAASFGARLIDDAERVQEDPSREPHVFSYVRKLPSDPQGLEHLRQQFKGHPDLPVSVDPFDERNWKWPNPGLDDFLSRSALREEALEAQHDRAKENAFRQYRMNQRVQQVTREIQLAVWDANIGELCAAARWVDERLEGQRCWAGLDLSSREDLTAWCLVAEDGWCRWRIWCPEAMVSWLDEATSGQFSVWARSGWVSLTDGDAIDYEQVYREIEEDCRRFRVMGCYYDRWSGEPVKQEIQRRARLEMTEKDTTYAHMTEPMQELQRLLKAQELKHAGNPVARWMVDNLEGKSPADDADRRRPVKPDRKTAKVRIDGIVALYFALDARRRALAQQYDVLESVR